MPPPPAFIVFERTYVALERTGALDNDLTPLAVFCAVSPSCVPAVDARVTLQFLQLLKSGETPAPEDFKRLIDLLE